MVYEISEQHFDDTLESILAVSVCGIVLAGLWIIIVLVQIEGSKASFFMVDKDQDLELSEEGMEVENNQNPENVPPTLRRKRNVPCSFKLMQVGSVLILILLTYLLLVTSRAPLWLSALGSICVFGIFLRYQIGDEIRRQRWDRLLMLLSLFMLIAAFLNLATWTFKNLQQGELYVGPARIVGYNMESYNNSNTHDPTTRTDVMVSWGKGWGCPMSNGKVCQAHVQGVMCAIHGADDDNETSTTTGGGGDVRRLNNKHNKHHNNSTNSTSAPQNHTQDQIDQELEQENKDLEQQNAELEKEVEELEEKNDEEEDLSITEENTLEDELIGDEFEDAKYELDAEEEADEAQADADEMEEELDKEEIKEEEDETTDDSVKEELEKDVEELDEEEDETADEVDEEIDELDSIEDEYSEIADEYYDEADANLDEEWDEYDEVESLDEEIEETQDAVGWDKKKAQDDIDDWVWDETNLDYDDDIFDSGYWNYDWDSAWGDQECNNLFETDVQGQTYDANVRPGGDDDDWPFINIYGSCKTCDAYVLDYFAEQAFETLDDYFLQSVMYFGFGISGMLLSLFGFIKYKLAPPAENQVELLGSDGGVIA